MFALRERRTHVTKDDFEMAVAKVMKKCTLCIDRIYNPHLPEEDRIPACVRACPTGA